MAMTPLRETLEMILEEDRARFYTPGHKGKLPFPLEDAAPYDITEIEGADSLYSCDGPLRRTEERLAAAVGAGDTLLSAGGSTLCIQTMLFLARRLGRTVIAARNLHRSAVSVMGLLGMDPVWIPLEQPSEEEGIPGVALPPQAERVRQLLDRHPDAAAVYITSPDYYGQMPDVAALADICHRRGKLLLVDNAHGAHLGNFRVALHPMPLGADLCCDSLHKTLPSLTGAAALHLAAPALYEDAKYAMSLFGSTSPSYLILLSAETALEELEEKSDRWLRLSARVDALREMGASVGYGLTQGWVRDPIRLTLGFEGLGYTGHSYGVFARQGGVEPEYVSDRGAVFLLSPNNTPRDLDRLERMVEAGGRGRRRQPVPRQEAPPLPRQVVSLSEAMSRPAVFLPVERAVGRVAARLVSTCPPGTPLVVPGEEITSTEVKFLQSGGIQRVSVIK